MADAVGDALGCIAHALEIGIDLDDAEDEAQIVGHGLLHGEQVERVLIDVALHAVDGDFAAADEVADGEVAHAVRLNRPLDGLLGQPSHDEEIHGLVGRGAGDRRAAGPGAGTACRRLAVGCCASACPSSPVSC